MHKTKNIVLLSLFWLSALICLGQEMTKVQGKVIDANTKEPLPFVNISYAGANIGTTTDFDGNYYLETQWATSRILASFVGYQTDTMRVTKGKNQTINFELKETSITMEAVTITGEKEKYKNKDNPAVDLIKLVIDHKKNNRKEAMDYFEYDKYEKIEIDLNNLTEDFLSKGWLKKHFQIVIDNIDTSEVNGKPFLPIYIRENSSKVYYRQKPNAEKEYILGTKQVGFEDYLDEEGMSKYRRLRQQH